MSDQKDRLRVRIVPGEIGRYHVESRSDPANDHLVDLFMNGGHGCCHCTDWWCNRWPLIREGAKLGDPKTTCAHIRAARNKFLFDTLREGALRFGKQEG